MCKGGMHLPVGLTFLYTPPKNFAPAIPTPVTSEMIVARPCVTRGFCHLEHFRLGLNNSLAPFHFVLEFGKNSFFFILVV